MTCWACSAAFVQLGPGRPRMTCGAPACEAKRRKYRKRGMAAIDRMEG